MCIKRHIRTILLRLLNNEVTNNTLCALVDGLVFFFSKCYKLIDFTTTLQDILKQPCCISVHIIPPDLSMDFSFQYVTLYQYTII